MAKVQFVIPVLAKFKKNSSSLEYGLGRRDRMEVGFTTIYAIRTYRRLCWEFESRSDEVYSIQHYVTKFVSDLRQVGGFLRVFRFPPPIELIATI